jgi:hypothetical protein
VTRTPEGKVKDAINAVLKKNGAYYFCPVQNGLGAAGLDYHCCIGPFAFFVEAKSPGKEPTPRQKKLIAEHRARGTKVFVIDSALGAMELDRWLEERLLLTMTPASSA